MMNWLPVFFLTILIYSVCSTKGTTIPGMETQYGIKIVVMGPPLIGQIYCDTVENSLRPSSKHSFCIYVWNFKTNERIQYWQHLDHSDSSVGRIPKINARIISYWFKTEKFDNYTYVRVVNPTTTSHSQAIILEPSIVYEDNNIAQLKFSDTTIVTFDCGEFLHRTKYVYVGLINTTENKITTMNTTEIMKSYNEIYNGSILCCLFYTTEGNSSESTIERHVDKKTLLLYYSTDEKGNSSILVVITISTAATLVFVVVTIIVIRKRLNTSNSPRTRPQLALPRNQAKKSNPFYLNLLFRKECEREIKAAEAKNEEPHYEEIL
uniref:Uncharacterized protein n=1 Tax=Heliothis virescens TaxID=7102 RepID=A0A2A4JSZ5_HELVI